MTASDMRKLAHQMLDELEEKEVAKVIKTMHHLKNNDDIHDFPKDKPTSDELEAIKKAKKEYSKGESYTHEEVFGEEDYVWFKILQTSNEIYYEIR